MTIGTYTFYTTNALFAIENRTFFQKVFEFIVNLSLNLLKINKKKKILAAKNFCQVCQKPFLSSMSFNQKTKYVFGNYNEFNSFNTFSGSTLRLLIWSKMPQ